MTRYLDPRADVVFKKIFGENPHLLKSFLNAVLPLEENNKIVELTYLPPEQIPTLPILKRTIVDVKCEDARGRVFIVEMQIGEKTTTVPQELLDVPEIAEAVHLAEQAAYTESELRAYNDYWDAVGTEKTLMTGRFREGKVEGRAEGLVEGEAIGLEKGLAEGEAIGIQKTAKTMRDQGFDLETISRVTGLVKSDIDGVFIVPPY